MGNFLKEITAKWVEKNGTVATFKWPCYHPMLSNEYYHLFSIIIIISRPWIHWTPTPTNTYVLAPESEAIFTNCFTPIYFFFTSFSSLFLCNPHFPFKQTHFPWRSLESCFFLPPFLCCLISWPPLISMTLSPTPYSFLLDSVQLFQLFTFPFLSLLYCGSHPHVYIYIPKFNVY